MEKGGPRVVARHPKAIVENRDEALSSILDLDDDSRCLGVERVFDELLDHRSRAIDDFPGGNLVGQNIGKNVYPPHGGSIVRRGSR